MAILQNKFVREDGSIIGSSVIISCKYTSDVNSQTNLTVGDTTAAEVDVEIRNPAKEITAGEKLTYYQIEDGVENLIGVFYTEAPTVATKTSIRFKAYDGKAKLAVDFSEWLNNNQARFPMTVRSLGNAACEVAGLVLAADSFQFENLSIPAFYAQGVTCRQIISWIAQLNGSFVSCNTAGEIFFDWYRETDISVGKTDFSQDGLSKKTYSTDLIQRVQFKQETNDVGIIYPADADGNVFSISQNGIAALLDSDTLRTIAQYLYNKLKTITYTPLSVKLPKRTAKIKAGDIVSVTDGNGETVKTYVMKVYLDSSGTQISSTGDQDYADKAAVSSEQYKNIPGKVLLLEKSVDGLRIENADFAGKVADLELNVDGITARVKNAEGDISKIEQTAGEVHVTAQKTKIAGVAYTFTVDGNGNLVIEYSDEEPPGYSINENGELVLEYEGDTPPDTWIDENGVLQTTDDSVAEVEVLGSLETNIDGDGVWESVYAENDKVVSSIRFDFAKKRFVFDGDIVVGDDLTNSVTTIAKNAITVEYLNALGIKAGSVDAENITGEVITGKHFVGATGEFSGVLTAGEGSSLGGFKTDWNSLFVGEWSNTAPEIFMCTGTNSEFTIAGHTSAGWTFGVSDKWGVTRDGGMYSVKGQIGGWYIEDDCLSSTDGSVDGVRLFRDYLAFNDSEKQLSYVIPWSELITKVAKL